MVRRTKADAEATRHSLLDAAERLFQAQGVSGTSLNQIATAAGTTRGAIYWHFKDKADLFNAMMERVTLPLEETLNCVGANATSLDEPLWALRATLLNALHKTAQDEQIRRVFEVATHQVEYNDEMRAVRERHLQVRNQCMTATAEGLRAAAIKSKRPLPMPLEVAALGIHVMFDGLIQNWLLDTESFNLEVCGEQTLDAYLRGLGFSVVAAPAPRLPEAPPSKASADAKQPVRANSPTPARSRKRTT